MRFYMGRHHRMLICVCLDLCVSHAISTQKETNSLAVVANAYSWDTLMAKSVGECMILQLMISSYPGMLISLSLSFRFRSFPPCNIRTFPLILRCKTQLK